MDIFTGIISKIIEYTVQPVGRQVGYLINYKSNLESLRSQLKNLDAAKDRMKHRVDEVERNGKGVETDVQNWRTEADEITREVENILGDESQAKMKCFRGVCANLVSYHQLSRKSAKLAKKIELHAKKEFPSVSYEAPVEDICAIPSQEYMAFESRTSMLKQIMEELKNPDTNMIGVYGLGGVGKTTLAKEVFRQVNKEEKLFDDVVIILNVKEKMDIDIQKEIAEKFGSKGKLFMAQDKRQEDSCNFR
ncbi:disease resistance protein [Prunus yedoensis var. nudiflora]|uniref:Disease resistance protein n=1 Tax=Prunus yedoensis var. nudiflora TaxID=2094558 RepID=A0A315AAU3_PRUYE|nr:disease resistance protein [Prunus yedoensis var. nudiflora]